MRIIISDIETNGLLKTVTEFHCAVNIDYHTGEETWYRPWDFKKYLDDLEAAWASPDTIVCGHNFIKYDVPALDKLKRMKLGSRLNYARDRTFDTLVACRLLYANIKDTDAGRVIKGTLPAKLRGHHSLKAWGYRLGEYKGTYGEQEEAWEHFNEPMMEYCAQDVRVTCKLLEMILKNTWYFKDGEISESIYAVQVEHRAAWTLAKMERNGFPFDKDGAERLYSTLAAERANLKIQLIRKFGSWYQPKGGKIEFLHPTSGKPLPKFPRVVYPKVGGIRLKSGKLDKRDYVAGAPYTPVQHVTFSPTSRTHIIRVLKKAGWVPTEFTDAGQPIVDDEQLQHVHVDDVSCQEAIDLIRRYLMLQKRIGQLAEGDNAWLRLLDEDDLCIHGSVNPNGAVTGRATHSYPNVAQVPSCGAEYGAECRDLFGAGHNDWIQVGVDASGLELRCLGHFMSPYDGGQYIDTILNGDIHTQNQLAAGLPTRDNAKTFIYGFLYGAGAAKIGLIVGGDAKRGKELINSFLEKTPAIAALREAVQNALVESSTWVGGENVVKWKRKWIRGLDGRKVNVRSAHSALNTLLQSAGALICKVWVFLVEENLEKAGYVHGWDGDFALMAWVHKLHCAR